MAKSRLLLGQAHRTSTDSGINGCNYWKMAFQQFNLRYNSLIFVK